MDIETGSAESATIVGTILQSFAFGKENYRYRGKGHSFN